MTEPISTPNTTRAAAQEAARDAALDAEVRDRFTAHEPAALDPVFREALRTHLRQMVTASATASGETTAKSEAVSRPARRRHWPRRRTLTLAAVLAAGLGGGGAALASGVLPLPGADDVVLRTPAQTVVHTGTATVDLGERPAGVTSVELTLTCLSAGTFTFDDGASLSCAPGDVTAQAASVPTPGLAAQHSGSAGYTLALKAGQSTTTITATAGTRWSLTTAYSTRTPTEWALNAHGQTYGVTKDDGSQPDLIAVVATTSTGQQGYVRASDLNPPLNFTSPQEAAQWSAAQPPVRTLPVYASDGTTVIGSFQAG
ncbi:hypothetical protein AB2L28_13615 [Kineococcus sp. TBRC 1896]|uniref:DUF4179 domain-containing protein n=1 Tax=Kineococcus mangrovi TaxID=1660183 RepID=A0ABV4I6E9_9ACTN